MDHGVLSRLGVECSALGFQAVVTSLLAIACWILWRHQRQTYFLTWSLAWLLYAGRLAAMSTYLVRRDLLWLAVHQTFASLVSLLLLLAAFQFSSNLRWRLSYLWLGLAALVWGWASIYVIQSMLVAGTVSIVLLSAVTIWTGFAFWRYRLQVESRAAPVLAWTFWLWGLHHLDYPLLRRFGGAVLYGMFVDVLFIFMAALGTLFLVLGDERSKLASRNAQLEQLTRLLLRAQEDERRRIARELHDEAGQVLSVVKMELDLDNRREASALVAGVLSKVRDLSNLLRPAELDDLGLLPTLRGLIEEFARRTRYEATLETGGSARTVSPDVQVMIYRLVQEALTNVIRHAGASRVQVRLDFGTTAVDIRVEDDGQGPAGEVRPQLGLLFMRERVAEFGGTLSTEAVFPAGERGARRGFRVHASIPLS
jgi:signal transduction histidine kinase